IRAVVRRSVSSDGVWNADLGAVSREIVERLPWVRTAVISRVMPDGLRVRVTERVPRAVVRTSAGKLMWVDEDAVVLGAMSATDHMPAFFMRGWDDAKTDLARAENRERVQKFLEMSREWEALGLSERISEVNLADLKDVRAQLAGNDSQVEIWLGKEDFGNRLKRALEELDVQRQTPRGPFITHVDVTQGVNKGSRIAIGWSPNAQALSANTASDNPNDAHAESAKNNDSSSTKVEQTNRSKDAKPRKQRKDDEKQKKHERDKKDSFAEQTKTRPRRVG
ncbi:MAG: FtsQ-type POTRA domain-containing protein, partial [Pyrinomonadaceae bacterium]